MRARFVWRLALALAVLTLMAVGLVIGFLWIAGRVVGWAGPPRPWEPFVRAPVLLLLILGVIGAVRAVQRLAAPIGDLIEGTGRVAEGEYGARVTERGPR
jgi:hypothetical protein